MLPPETIQAIFPRPTSAEISLFPRKRTLRLHCMTLFHAVALEAWGCDLGGELDESHALIAAWLLAKPASALAEAMADMDAAGAEAKKWMRGMAKCVARIAEAVRRHIFAQFKTFVPPAKEGETLCEEARGFGWPLETAEFLSSEYGWRLDEALQTPVETALALVSVARQRQGGKAGGPDYYERIKIAELKKAGIF